MRIVETDKSEIQTHETSNRLYKIGEKTALVGLGLATIDLILASFILPNAGTAVRAPDYIVRNLPQIDIASARELATKFLYGLGLAGLIAATGGAIAGVGKLYEGIKKRV